MKQQAKNLVTLQKKIFKENEKLIFNFLSLGLVQATNYIIPIITFPYIYQIIGVAKFGKVSLALSIMFYLAIFVDYGFNISAPKEISQEQNDKSKIAILFINILTTKIIITLGLFIISIISIQFFKLSRHDFILYTFGFLYVIGNTLQINWFFQGIEKMQVITTLNLVAKLLLIVIIYTFIAEPKDYIYVVGLYGISNIVSAIIGIIYIKITYVLQTPKLSIYKLYDILNRNWFYFQGSISSVAYSNSSVLILSMFSSNILVGYYSMAEKVIFAVWQLLNVFSQATFPKICILSNESHKEVKQLLKNIHFPFFYFITLSCIILFLSRNIIASFLTPNDINKVAPLIGIMSFLPIFVCANISAYQVLIAYNFQKPVASILNQSILLNISICLFFSYFWGSYGCAWSAVITQMFVCLYLHLTLQFKYTQYSIF